MRFHCLFLFCRWRLEHHPTSGRITMTIHTVTELAGVRSVDEVVNTGNLFDKRIRGGRIGWFIIFREAWGRRELSICAAFFLLYRSKLFQLRKSTLLEIYLNFHFSVWLRGSAGSECYQIAILRLFCTRYKFAVTITLLLHSPGLYSQGQTSVTFANVKARCLLPENSAASFNGASHVISLGDISGLGITRSFELRSVYS